MFSSLPSPHGSSVRHFDDHAVMHQAVDRRCCRHRIFEDLVPFAERQVARQQNAPSFVAFGKQREQHLHFLSVLLHVAQVVDDQALVAPKRFDQPRQSQVPLRDQQLLHQQTAGREQHAATLVNQTLASAHKA